MENQENIELEKNFKKFKKITKEEYFISKEIKKRAKINEEDTILDVGCADGNLSKSLVKTSKNITFLDVDEFDFSPQEKFIHSSFEKAEIDEKYDYLLTSHVWGHFYRNKTFDFCFKKSLDLLKKSGKLIAIHNSNKDFMGKLIEFSKSLFEEMEFDVFLDSYLKNRSYKEDYFDVKLKAKTYRELAELIQVLIIVPDELYYNKIEAIIKFLKKNLKKPEFNINQRIIIIDKNEKEIQNQEQVWDNIAEEWHEFKKIPSQKSIEFLEQTSGKVLDLGSGSGRHLTKVKDMKPYLVDFSQNLLDLAKSKAKKLNIEAEFIKSDLSKLPSEDNFFDYAISISALHCLTPESSKKAIKELYRVLKPKAQVFIGVWNEDSKRFKNKKNKTKELSIGWRDKGKRYYYLFNEEEIHNLFKKTGFKIISTHNSEMMINFVATK